MSGEVECVHPCPSVSSVIESVMKGLLLVTVLNLCVRLCLSQDTWTNNLECGELVLIEKEFDPMFIPRDESFNEYPIGTVVNLNYFEAPPWSYLY